MGAEGVGRRTLTRRFLDEVARSRPAPSDWCYVFNFEAAHRPKALALPAGRGAAFRRDMARLVDDLKAGIPAAFEADEYRSRRQAIDNELAERQEAAIRAVGERAKARNVALVRTPGGLGLAPLKDDDVMPPEAFRELPEEERRRVEAAIDELQHDVEHVLEQLPKWRREAQRKARELDRQAATGVIASLIAELEAEYRALPDVVRHLHAVQEDVLENAPLFQAARDGETNLLGMLSGHAEAGDAPLRRFAVNLLVDHGATSGAPIVDEDHPTHDNLVGRIEHASRLGTLVTDFTMIQAGALHRANGGYLVVDVAALLKQPLAWEALKRALTAREIRTESLAQALGLASTQALEPDPIPLDVKVVLIGPRRLYELLHAFEPAFPKLFRVAVDFEDDVERTADAEIRYARLIAAMARRHGLRPLARAAVERVVEQASRECGSAERLAAGTARLLEVLREANHHAGRQDRAAIEADDVRAALDARIRRIDRLPDRVRDEVLRGRLLVATRGAHVGQANGLSVVELGGIGFGLPVRITARVHLGSGNVVDIEREAELGGRIHAKGVMILSGYLASAYAPSRPLSLAATLVFEQTYGTVEGDSASSAELYALLSALAEVPLSNALAITGSVNQHGEVQAIGGVNEKVEGWFDLCSARGLDGSQGVLVPASNVPQLMLRDDVVEAVACGRFAIHAVDHVDRGLEILTGLPAGQRDALGHFPRGSLNARIEERLADFAERARSFAAPSPRPRRGRERR
jgi:lon-related putative ATP-dependent protease